MPIKELEGVEICESWFWNEDELRDQLNELRRKLRLLEKERKLQPPLKMQGIYGKVTYTVIRYQILDLEKGQVLAEYKVEGG